MLQLRGFDLWAAVSRKGHLPRTLMNSVLTKVTQCIIYTTWYKTSASIIFEIYIYVQKLHYFEMSIISIFSLKSLEIFLNYFEFDLMSQKFDPIKLTTHPAHTFLKQKRNTLHSFFFSVQRQLCGGRCWCGLTGGAETHEESQRTKKC